MQPKDLHLPFPLTHTHSHQPFCHPERSAAQPKDLHLPCHPKPRPSAHLKRTAITEDALRNSCSVRHTYRHVGPPHLLRLHRSQPDTRPLHRLHQQPRPADLATQAAKLRRFLHRLQLQPSYLVRTLQPCLNCHRSRETTQRLDPARKSSTSSSNKTPPGSTSARTGPPSKVTTRSNHHTPWDHPTPRDHPTTLSS